MAWKPAPNAQITVTWRLAPILRKQQPPMVAEQHIVTNDEGDSLEWREGKQFPHDAQFALCRCGHSRNKPFCDGTHAKVGFDGTETASREPYVKLAEEFSGPTMVLKDADLAMCLRALLRCPRPDLESHQADRTWRRGASGWNRRPATVRGDVWSRLTAKPAMNWSPSFSLPSASWKTHRKKSGGPLWIRGEFKLWRPTAIKREIRNRVTLCRCGHLGQQAVLRRRPRGIEFLVPIPRWAAFATTCGRAFFLPIGFALPGRMTKLPRNVRADS